jgi:hypothetical protein
LPLICSLGLYAIVSATDGLDVATACSLFNGLFVPAQLQLGDLNYVIASLLPLCGLSANLYIGGLNGFSYTGGCNVLDVSANAYLLEATASDCALSLGVLCALSSPVTLVTDNTYYTSLTYTNPISTQTVTQTTTYFYTGPLTLSNDNGPFWTIPLQISTSVTTASVIGTLVQTVYTATTTVLASTTSWAFTSTTSNTITVQVATTQTLTATQVNLVVSTQTVYVSTQTVTLHTSYTTGATSTTTTTMTLTSTSCIATQSSTITVSNSLYVLTTQQLVTSTVVQFYEKRG